MSGERALSGLALARRAGKLVMGFDAAMKTARKGDAAFVVLSDALSPKPKRKRIFTAKNTGWSFTKPVLRWKRPNVCLENVPAFLP